MPPIKSPAMIAEKWVRATATRAPDYEFGVKNPRRDWATETLNAESAYNTGMAASLADARWPKGVAKAGTPKWLAGVLKKGVQRWAPGVAAGQEAYKIGFTPYAEVIARTILPPRGARGDPGNIERVRVMAQALHAAKLAMAS